MSGNRTRAMIATAVAVAAMACAGGAATCVEATLSRQATAALAVIAADLDFTPLLPCGYGPGFVVESVIVDTLPGAPPQRRVSFIVERSGRRSYVLSQTRVPVTSTQIPQGTHRLRVAAGDVIAQGFAGPTGSGGEMAYLRWRIDGITYELDATLGGALDEAEALRIVRAVMQRASPAPEAPGTPSAAASGFVMPLEEVSRGGTAPGTVLRA